MAHLVRSDIVQDMPVDEFDSTEVTEEMPPVGAARADGDPAVFAGRVRPVVLSDVELAQMSEVDDPSAYSNLFAASDRGDTEGDGKGPDGQPLEVPDRWRLSLVSLLAHGALVVMLAIPAMLIVAFGIAIAAR